MRAAGRRAWAAVLLAGALALPNVTSIVGVALAPQLLVHAPIVLLVLHPYAPVGLLVRPEVALGTFVVVSVAARLAPRYLAYRAGWAAGREEVERYAARRPSARLSRLLDLSERAMAPALVFAAGAPVSALAGALGISSRRFLLLSTLGATFSTVVLLAFGAVAAEPVQWASRTIAANPRWWCGLLAVGAAAALVVVGLLRWRRG